VTSLLHEYVQRQAQQRPDAGALVMGDEHLTYGALEAESNRQARLLVEAGVRAGDRVCMLLPKSPATIVSMIAVLKAGAIYVPMDVASPAARLEKIVSAADPTLVMTTRSVADLLDELTALTAGGARPTVGTVDTEHVEGARFRTSFTSADWASQSAEPLRVEGSSNDPAHILFTSGSTGTPKGVVITHANVIPFVEWAVEYFGIAPDDRVSGHPPLHFDLSTFDIFGSFRAGAELHLVPAALNVMAHQLAALIRDSELTQWFSVPSAMTYLATFDALAGTEFAALRRVIWCGEVLPTPVLIHWMRRLPAARFTNLYGPTEATIASSYYTVPGLPATETESIPIGAPCPGEELLVLDAELRAVPPEETGDLYIAGVGLSPGYWRDPEKTAAAFLPDPRSSDPDARIYKTGDLARIGADGLVTFLGRADTQIKSRGHRIELGEIEAALNALDTIHECAVVGVETGGFEGTTICCAYDAATDGVTPARVRSELRSSLPSYMLPSRWLVLDELPKNVNGKIDRRLLREAFEEQAGREAEGADAGRLGVGS
jgi:amino acid adenylation domain-containing protein